MMIKTIKTVALLAATQLGSQMLFAQAGSGTYRLEGQLRGIDPMPTRMYLYKDHNLTDSATVKDGEYQFAGKIDELTNVILVGQKLSGNGLQSVDMISLLLDAGELQVVSENRLDHYTSTGPGADANNEYRAAIAHTLHVADSIKEIAASPEFKTDRNLQNAVQIRVSNMFKSVNDEMVSYLPGHLNGPAAVYLMTAIASSPFTSTGQADSLIALLPAASQKRVRAKIATQMIATQMAEKKANEEQARIENSKTAAIGIPAPIFAMEDTAGKPVNLSSFKGKYLLIDFWASWCGPCRAENPNVVKAYQAYKAKGFDILGVSLDGKGMKDKWLEAIQKDGLAWTQVSDLAGWENQAAKLYGVQAIPQNFLIDPQGNIIAKNLRGEALGQKLAEVLGGQ